MDIYDEIRKEIANQNKKWGVQHHSPWYWMVILMEEVGEACQAICGKTWKFKQCRKELIQVAAVAIAIINCLDMKELT